MDLHIITRFSITFKYISFIKKSMSQNQTTITTSSVSKIAIVTLALIFGFGLFVVGFDQGHIFSVVMGEQAFDEMFIHELTHDMRHAAGFPCH
jgi:hypothetical protein